MLSTKFKSALAVVVAAGSLALASQASAVTLTTGDTFYLGLINDGIPSGASAEVGYVNTLLAQPLNSGPTLVGTEFYTRSGNLCDGGACDPAELADSVKNETGNNVVDLLGTSWTYVLGKYDASQAGSYVWYVAGLTEITLPGALGSCGSANNPTGCGLSHYTLFNPGDDDFFVPEPAMLGLLGLGLFGIVAARRRRNA